MIRKTIILVVFLTAIFGPQILFGYPWPLPVKPETQEHPIYATLGEYREATTNTPRHLHKGVDIAEPNPTAVFPVIDGNVVSIGNDIVRIFGSYGIYFDYIHVIPDTNLFVGMPVSTGITPLGTIQNNHLHFQEKDGELNPLRKYSGLSPFSDIAPPTINSINILRQGLGQPYPTEGGVPIVDGQANIRVNAKDSMSNNGSSKVGVYEIGYKIVNASGTTVADYQGKIHFDTIKDYKVDLIYDTNLSKNDNYEYWVTNSPTANEYWNTTETISGIIIPNGNYTIEVIAEDTMGNPATYVQPVIIRNPTWTISTVDSGPYVGVYNSIATDSNNKVHISYLDWNSGYYHLKYATNASGSWDIKMVDSTGSLGEDTSLAIDSNNKVHISYLNYDGYDWALKYATNATGTWETYTIDGVNGWGKSTSIAVDSNNNVHISYYGGFENYNYTKHLKYATNKDVIPGTGNCYAGSDFNCITVDSTGDAGQYSSIAIDSNNKVHISYYYSDSTIPQGRLKYATNSSGSWTTTELPEPDASDWFVGYYTSIAVDLNNKVHISYQNVSGVLKYATNASGSWVISTIIKAGIGNTSIAIDSNNNAHISFPNWGAGLNYATNSSGTWSIYPVNRTANTGNYSSITIDSNNRVHISYLAGWPYYELRYATNVVPVVDADGDGYPPDVDCNDNNPSINPGATEACDGIDNNCDGQIDEGNVCGVPDLLVSTWTAPANACAGASISIKDTTKNQGTGLAGASTTKFYFSTNTTLDAGDTPLGSRSVPSLNPAAISTGTTSVILPNVAIGKYYLIAMADDGKVVTESNETNNKKSKVIYIGPDLIVSTLTAPTSAVRGTTISIGDTTKNKGCGAAGASTTKFYLSTNTTIGTGDIDLGARSVPSLGTNATSPGTTNVTIPSGIALGKYYIIANSDDTKVVVEGNEGNNKKTKAITINP